MTIIFNHVHHHYEISGNNNCLTCIAQDIGAWAKSHGL